MTRAHVDIPAESIAAFSRKWRVRELSLFGSVLREDFRAGSDVDVLVEFFPDAAWSHFDLVDMTDELSGLLGRTVDLVEKRALRNPFRRQAILSGREVVYAA